MDENPYQSPREEGYDPPRPGLDAKIKDMIAVWVTGLLCFTFIMAVTMLITWLRGGFAIHG